MNILGINAYHGDVSAALFCDGVLVAAVEEERFRRIKHVAGFPEQSIRACLGIAGLSGRDVHHMAVSRRPRAHLWRKALFALRHRPGRDLVANRASNYRRVGEIPHAVASALDLAPGQPRPAIHWVEHHPAHLASTFFVSPFESAAVCAIDGFGDFVSTSWAEGRDRTLAMRHRTFFPHSLGVFYLALTQYLGFTGLGDEYKVMGLAPYGAPDLVALLRQLVRLQPDGAFALDLSYFDHWKGHAAMTWDDGEPQVPLVFSPKLETLLGPRRRREDPIEARHQAVAASLQAVFEEAAFHVLRGVADASRQTNLCLAGGCAMNSVANGKIRRNTPFESVYIQPASADNGTALGAAAWVQHQVLGRARRFTMTHAYWGPSFDGASISASIAARGQDLATAGCTVRELDGDEEVCAWTARRLADGQVVGWFQGRMEWGARALGNRSILADPRRADMRDVINARIKLRETFRPFAPSVLEEAVDRYFEDAVADPFMIQVYPVRAEMRATLPAVTHVDGSGRLQTVSRAANPLYWALIRAFEGLTGVPVLLNTSFNENEPIVHQPAEALDCFLRTSMDALVMGRHVIMRNAD